MIASRKDQEEVRWFITDAEAVRGDTAHRNLGGYMKFTFNNIRLLLPVRSPRVPEEVVHCIALQGINDNGSSLVLDASQFLDEGGLLNPRINISYSLHDEDPLKHSDEFVRRFEIRSSSWWWSNLRFQDPICVDLEPLFQDPSWAEGRVSDENALTIYHMAGLIQVEGHRQHIAQLLSPE